MSVEDNIEIVEAALKHVNAKEWDSFESLYSESTVWYGPGASDVVRGRDDVMNSVKSFVKAFPDAHREKRRVLGEGDLVYLELVETGTHKGPFELEMKMVSATNKRIELHICLVFKIGGGKIVETRSYYDELDLLKPIGVFA